MGGRSMDRKVETCPPKVIERVVQLLIPPASREHVLGDLSERYESTRQYLVDALRTLPFVVVSRVRRTSNPPLDTAVVVMLWFWAVICGGGNMSGLPPGLRHLSRSACSFYAWPIAPTIWNFSLRPVGLRMGCLWRRLSQLVLGLRFRHSHFLQTPFWAAFR